MKKGIILDDKITENRAKEWERSLLSRFSSQRKTILYLCEMTDVNYTYCGNHFTLYTYIIALWNLYNVICQHVI